MTKEDIEKIYHYLAGLDGMIKGLIIASMTPNKDKLFELSDEYVNKICDILNKEIEQIDENNASEQLYQKILKAKVYRKDNV